MTKKGIYLLVGIFIAYAALTATHKGEFWPFSIYPMFSQAGQPWNHSLVRKVSGHSSNINWSSKTKSELPGSVFALNKIGINQNDLTAYIDKRNHWNQKRIQGLRAYFGKALNKDSFLIFRVHGQIRPDRNDSVTVTYIPFVLIRKDTTLFNPRVFGSSLTRSSL
jgi:hypothetical protein